MEILLYISFNCLGLGTNNESHRVFECTALICVDADSTESSPCRAAELPSCRSDDNIGKPRKKSLHYSEREDRI
jgi:hypothetical protein